MYEKEKRISWFEFCTPFLFNCQLMGRPWSGANLFFSDSTYPVVFTMSCNRINFSEFCLGIMHCVILCRTWNWRGYSIRYQYAGSSGPALVLIHGFGANRSTYHILLLVNFWYRYNKFLEMKKMSPSPHPYNFVGC